jgi:hypothetical protein
VRWFVVAAYALPAVLVWLVLGLCLAALPLTGVALAGAVLYGGYYGVLEITGGRGLPPPGRQWQVPQSMLIDAAPRRRVLLWGAILGPGFLTRNPYAGFGLLPLAVAAMPGTLGAAGTGPLAGLRAGLVIAAAIGLAHGTARALALVRDLRDMGAVAPASPLVAQVTAAQLTLLLKTVYWRRIDGVVLLAVAVTALLAAVRYFT